MAYTPQNFINSFIRNKDGNIVIWQFPNLPLWGWFTFTILAMIATEGRLHSGFLDLARVLLFVWAYLEIRSGESMFRRVLGSVVLLYIVVGYFR